MAPIECDAQIYFTVFYLIWHFATVWFGGPIVEWHGSWGQGKQSTHTPTITGGKRVRGIDGSMLNRLGNKRYKAR